MSRLSVLLFITLLAAGCGGSDSAGTADEIPDATISDADFGPEPREEDFLGTLDTDPSALNTNPVTPADFAVAPRGEREVAPGITPVVDTCAALSGAELASIVEAAAERDAFGGDYPFDDGTPSGAACTYASDTHRLTVIIGSADQVTSDAGNGAVMVPIMGEVTGSDWAGNSDVTLFSEDSFDLNTFFAAHYVTGDYGVVVNNSGGTGLDPAGDGALFAKIAVAAGNGAASAPGPSAADEGSAVVTTADLCGLYSQAELEAFLGIHLGEATSLSDTGVEACYWSDDNPTQRTIRIDAGAPGELFVPADAPPTAEDDRIVLSPFNSPSDAYVVVDGVAFSIAVTIFEMVGEENRPSPEGTTAAVEIAQNLLARLDS